MTEWQKFISWFTAGNPEPPEGPELDLYVAMREVAWSSWNECLRSHQHYFNEFF